MSYDTDKSADNPVAEATGQEGGEGQEGHVGTADPSKRFREMEISEEEQREIAEDRKERLDPANRPENAEVDNTHRTFEDGEFKD